MAIKSAKNGTICHLICSESKQSKPRVQVSKDKRTISKHIQNIFKEAELPEEAVVRKFRTTAADGKHYETLHYNLDVIISVDYRVKSHRGTQFRIWVTARLKEYLIKGFALDERLKRLGGGNYMACSCFARATRAN